MPSRGLRVILTTLTVVLTGAILRAEPAYTNHAGELAGIVVTATRTPRSVLDLPASADLIDAGMIERVIPINVEELFRGDGRVELQGSGVPGSPVRLNLRGLTPGYQTKRVLVLIDGRRINDAFQGNAEFALLPADGIERIEVVRGPGSALYGSNAMGGIINIITRRGSEDPYTRFTIKAGNHQTVHADLGHGGKVGAFEYFVAASGVDTDGYMQNSNGSDRDWSARNVSGRFGWQLNPESEIELFLGAYTAAGTEESSQRDSDRDHQAATYRLAWNKDQDAVLLVRAYRNGGKDVFDWVYPGIGTYRQETIGAEAQQSLLVADRHHLSFGVDTRRDNVDIEDVMGSIDEDDSIVGLYIQDEIPLNDRLQLTAGLRHDDNRDYGGELSPRLGLVWRAAEQAEVFAAFNHAHRAPSLSDRYVHTEFNGMVFEGNPDLERETLVEWEAGVRQRFGSDIGAELVFFHNDLEDGFDFIRDDDGVFRIRNVTRMETYGLEAALRWRVNRNLSAFANGAITEGTYDEFLANPAVEGNRLAYLAKYRAALGLDYTCGDTTHTLRGRFVGSRYGDARNSPEQKMDDYFVVDWYSRIALADGMRLLLEVQNLFDVTYQDFPDYDQPGITVMAGLELDL